MSKKEVIYYIECLTNGCRYDDEAKTEKSAIKKGHSHTKRTGHKSCIVHMLKSKVIKGPGW